MQWWDWTRAQRALETWVRVLIGPRPYAIRFGPREGSFVRFDRQEIVIDPLMVNDWGGETLLPIDWRGQSAHTLAGLQWRVARTMARHEAGHVLFTASHAVAGEVHAWLTNALEDARMERLTGALSRPARADFLALARLLAAHMPLPDPALRPRADILLNACLFARWDVFRAPGTPSRYCFATDDDARLWESAIRPLVEAAWAAPDVHAVADIAIEILKHLAVPSTDTLAGHGLLALDTHTSRGSRRPGDAPLAVMHSNALGGDDTDSVDDDPTTVVGTHTVAEDEPPTIDVDPSAGTLWPRPYRALASEVAPLQRRLLQVLRAPAPNVAPRRSATSGAFSARAYARTQGERPLEVKREVADDPTGLAICLLIDRTTSMGPPPSIDRRTGEPDASFASPEHRITHARRAAMLLELTCMAAGIPLAIGYAGDRGYAVHLPHAFGSRTFFHRPDRPVVWLRTFETPRSAEGPKALIAGLYGDSYSERVSASLLESQRMLLARPEQTRLILYVHDGSPTDETPLAVAETVAQVRRRGVRVLGVFVGEQEQLPSLQAIFGERHTIPVPTLADLPTRLGRVLLRAASRW